MKLLGWNHYFNFYYSNRSRGNWPCKVMIFESFAINSIQIYNFYHVKLILFYFMTNFLSHIYRICAKKPRLWRNHYSLLARRPKIWLPKLQNWELVMRLTYWTMSTLYQKGWTICSPNWTTAVASCSLRPLHWLSITYVFIHYAQNRLLSMICSIFVVFFVTGKDQRTIY